jgi:hypothetical protein
MIGDKENKITPECDKNERREAISYWGFLTLLNG